MIVGSRRYGSLMTITIPSFTLTDVAAWVGALAGVAALIWQIVVSRRSAHKVKVTRDQSWWSYPNGTLSEDLVIITALNVGAGPVTVTHWGVSMETTMENLTVVFPLAGSTPLPHRLEPGANMILAVKAEDLRRANAEWRVPFRRLRGWVGLATGQKIYARRGMPVSAEPA